MGRRKKSNAGDGSPEAATPGGLRHPRLLLGLVVIALLVAVGGVLAGRGGAPSGPRTAAIVDQLSLTQPNPEFAGQARGLLAQAGYLVDYYPGEQVSVDFYRDLPARGYDLILLRVHSAIAIEVDPATGERTEKDFVGLFTGEPYDETKYTEEEQQSLLGPGHYYEGGAESFVVGPRFVEYAMRGRFDDTLIVMMGCDGLRSRLTAQAFLDKGAQAFVSWSQPVSASHTDAATQRLLEKLLLEGLPTADAVAQTAAEVGPDPSFGAELRFVEG